MDINTTPWFFDKIWNDNLCLLYNGNFGEGITEKVIDLSEYSVTNYDELSKMTRKLSGIVAECFQNIIIHSDSKPDKNAKNEEGFFLSRNFLGTQYITSGNLIEKADVESLQTQLQKINSLNKEELKLLYRNLLNNEEYSKNTITGLGLIDMARKSGQKLEYLFKEFNNDFSFFYNHITLKSKGATIENSISVNDSLILHEKMAEKEIFLVNKGDFSHDSILSLLNIIQNNLKEEFTKKSAFRRAYHILVELIQNIGRHCIIEDGIREGILLIGKKGSSFIVNTGNFMEKDKAAILEQKLIKLNQMDKEELKTLYKKTLVEGRLSEKGGAGIGLIDIVRGGTTPLQYSFNHDFPNKSFFSINVTV